MGAKLHEHSGLSQRNQRRGKGSVGLPAFNFGSPQRKAVEQGCIQPFTKHRDLVDVLSLADTS